MRGRIFLVLSVLLVVAPSVLEAQAVDSSYLDMVTWRPVGPTRGGRVLAVAGDPAHDFTFYQGTAGGGVWKTEDGGLNWANVSDGFFNTGSVGAIALAPSSSDIVYVGMGEACIRGNASIGDGVYKSTDGGKTWAHLGLETTSQIARVRVHPANPDLVYVAALGTPWGPGPDRGVYRSRDGGRTWQKILFRDDDTGAIDLILDPANPDVIYASLLQLRRYPWGFTSAGPGTGLFKSTDGGDHWTELTDNPGLPDGLKGRIGIAVSPARPDRVWAIIDAELGKKGVFRSDDGGATWTRTNEDADLTQRPWYYHHIFADPQDANTVYVLNVRSWKSTDGGVTFEQIDVPHGDSHDLWIDPVNPLRMVNANDGGATVSFNGGKSWSSLMNQPTAQLYHVAVDNGFPYRLYASQQDNTTISVPSRSDYGAITLEDSYTVGGGEDGYVAPRTDDPNVVYAGDHHFVYRYDHATKQIRDISPNPETYYGWGAADMLYRFWWTYPVMTSPHDPDVLYVTSQYVHRTADEGQGWEVVSPDLTRADPGTIERTPSYENSEPGRYWGPITREAYGPEWYATIFAFAESPAQAGVLWAGSDDGYVHVSRDNGVTWTRVNIPGLPDFTLISIIDPSHHAQGTAYVAATRYKLDDQTPYLYKTRDYGATWTRITTGIADGDFTRVIREDPERPGLLYAGTERTVYVSFDDGGHWQPLNHGLPVVPVHDIQVKDGDLAVATHGRSFWILDNVALLHQFDAGTLADAAHLFKPKNAVRFRDGADLVGSYSGSGTEGRNPPSGVVIPYFFRERPSGPVTLRILEGNEVVRTVEDAPAQAGGNRWVWNMRYPGARVLPDAVFQGSAQGPLAAPGTYTVELAAGGRTWRQSFEILRDPRIAYGDADLVAQHDFLIDARDKLSETMDLVKQIRDMRAEATRMVETAGGRQELVDALQRLNDKLYPLEERLVQYRARAGQDLIAQPTGIDSKLARLMVFASMADAPPTQGALQLFKRLAQGIQERAEAFARIRQEEYADLVRRARPIGEITSRRPVATYSIVARDSVTGEMGVAVQSHWFSVGAIVPWAEAGVGAVATQSFVEPSYGPLGLELMRRGRSAPDALRALVSTDANEAVRQVAMVDAQGRVAAHTGATAIFAAGHHVGDGFSTQANMMENPTVWDAMARAFEAAPGDLAERLLAALEAAEGEGGDIRGRQSAAIIVVSATSTGAPWLDRKFDLRVEDHPAPVPELRRLVHLQRAYNALNEGDGLVTEGDIEGAMGAYTRAMELVPDQATNGEAPFWVGITLASIGREDDALPYLLRATAQDARWIELAGRLPAAGLLPSAEVAQRLQGRMRSGG